MMRFCLGLAVLFGLLNTYIPRVEAYALYSAIDVVKSKIRSSFVFYYNRIPVPRTGQELVLGVFDFFYSKTNFQYPQQNFCETPCKWLSYFHHIRCISAHHLWRNPFAQGC